MSDVLEKRVSSDVDTSGETLVSDALKALKDILLGREEEIKLTLAAFLADGHVLLDGVPGVGKTVFAEAIARIMGLEFARVQFTSDLLPADLIGASIYDAASSGFSFHKGPVFTEILLIDEINRAGPKAQSALLEAMAEKQVSQDGESYPLSDFFFTIATRNPGQQLGTFPLPEAQLDRFLLRLELGYPDRETELELLSLGGRKKALVDLEPITDPKSIITFRETVTQLFVAEPILNYVRDILDYTRTGQRYLNGLSSRAGLSILALARVWGWMDGRDHVIPSDVQAILPSVIDHRLVPYGERDTGRSQGQKIIEAVPVP